MIKKFIINMEISITKDLIDEYVGDESAKEQIAQELKDMLPEECNPKINIKIVK